MKPNRLPLHVLMAVIGSGAAVISVGLYTMYPDWRWHRKPLHSTMESLGGLAAIAMAVVLFQRTGSGGGRLYPVATGFLGMGLRSLAIVWPATFFCLILPRVLSCFATPRAATAIWRWQRGLMRKRGEKDWDRRSVPNKGDNYETDSSLAHRRFFIRSNISTCHSGNCRAASSNSPR